MKSVSFTQDVFAPEVLRATGKALEVPVYAYECFPSSCGWTAQHASFLLAVWRYVTAECAQTKDTNGFQRAFNPHRLGRELFTLVSFTLEPLGGSRKFVKHVLCRTQIKIPRLLAFWVQCRSRCSNNLLQPKISPKLSYYKCPAKPESLLNFPKARFLQQSERLSLIDI